MARTAPSTKRRPGRPPDAGKRRAVIDATLELLAEVGYAGLTIDAVAQRAGSNRVLIYRVWDTKVALVIDALYGTVDDIVVPDTGALADDLRVYVRQLVASMARPAFARAGPALTAELVADPSTYRHVHTRFVQPTIDGMAAILRRAEARGELAPGADPRAAILVISGTTTALATSMRISQERILDLVLGLLVGGLLVLRDSA